MYQILGPGNRVGKQDKKKKGICVFMELSVQYNNKFRVKMSAMEGIYVSYERVNNKLI